MKRIRLALVASAAVLAISPIHAQRILGEITQPETCVQYLQQAQAPDAGNEPQRIYAVQLTEDEYILAQLNRALDESSEFESATVTANVSDGVVILGGLVDDPERRARIIALAEEIPGVREIEADLLWIAAAPERAPANTPAADMVTDHARAVDDPAPPLGDG